MAIGFVVGLLVGCLILLPKLNHNEQLNKKIIEENNNNLAKKAQLINDISQLTQDSKIASENYLKIMQLTTDAKANMSKELQEHKNNTVQLLQVDLNQNKEYYKQAVQGYRQEFLKTMTDLVATYRDKISASKDEYWQLVDVLDDLKRKVDSATEAAKRSAEMADKTNFYKINLTPTDIDEIQKLRKVLPLLRNSEPLNKVIWKVYYEKPTTDLIGRVVGSGIHCGIYKITNLENQMCYVGQAVNIGDRWKQHIKRGLGAETPTRNKLYPVMLSLGVENFSFEVIEECDRLQLNEREDYWQDFFNAKEFGYSIK